ncbi:MAG TPA: LLM class flavin-dependent oxidoreductase [Xanthobacteraceae bacterium]|nr:LLM class flavin-dependent oxidoreductase [Xanthobacteraceae bacterium]
MQSRRQLKLGFFLRPVGHHIAAWRHPDSQADAGENFEHLVEMAKLAERGLFDFIFCADAATVYTAQKKSLHRTHYVSWIEPMSLLTGIAARTSHIGLVATASTSFEEPYNVARRFSSLDLISGGRSGWNVVTTGSPLVAENFGAEPHPPKAERYRRAREFAEVVRGLWDSWDDDAFIRDREGGVYFDPSRMHPLGHEGAYYKVQGPLNVSRSPQGQPVLVQAGASDDGKDLAAEYAEVVFTAHDSIDTAKVFYADLKGRVQAWGRDPNDVKIMPGMLVSVAPTRQEAQDQFSQLQELIHPEIGLGLLSERLGIDMSGYPLDEPVPDIADDEWMRSSRSSMMFAIARRDKLTVRQLYTRFAASRGHVSVIGTPADVADKMEEWMTESAADGFNVMPPIMPKGLEAIVDLVIPELQRRGLFRTAYEGKTLRANLGLMKPEGADKLLVSG